MVIFYWSKFILMRYDLFKSPLIAFRLYLIGTLDIQCVGSLLGLPCTEVMIWLSLVVRFVSKNFEGFTSTVK